MSRIFAVLAVVSGLLIIIAIVLGLRVGRYNETYSEFLGAQQRLVQARQERDGKAERELVAQAELLYADLVEPRERATWHKLMGIVASLVAVLVNCISVTYFIGTSRWCKEVVDTYELDRDLADQSTKLKRRSFPWSFCGILVILMMVAFGAAADPATLRSTTMHWVLPHYVAALGGGAIVALAFWMQAGFIQQNSALVDRILARVHEIRVARGLDVVS